MDFSDKRIWIAIAVMAAIGLFAYQSRAEAASWSGCYVGGGVGYGSVNTDAELGIGAVASVDFNSLGSDGATLTAIGGCDIQVERFVFGGFADYSWHDESTFTLSLTAPGLSTDVATWSAENEWTIGGRAGVLLTPDVLAYGLVGYSKMEMSDADFLTGTPAALSIKTDEFSGWTMGAGMEAQLAPAVFVRAEYRYTDYDSEKLEIVPGLGLDMDPDVQVARVGIAYKFGMPDTAPSPLK